MIKLSFITLLAGILAQAVNYFFPDIPILDSEVLRLILLVLGIVGVSIDPTIRARLLARSR